MYSCLVHGGCVGRFGREFFVGCSGYDAQEIGVGEEFSHGKLDDLHGDFLDHFSGLNGCGFEIEIHDHAHERVGSGAFDEEHAVSCICGICNEFVQSFDLCDAFDAEFPSGHANVRNGTILTGRNVRFGEELAEQCFDMRIGFVFEQCHGSRVNGCGMYGFHLFIGAHVIVHDASFPCIDEFLQRLVDGDSFHPFRVGHFELTSAQ